MIETATLYDNQMLSLFRDQQRKKIEELQQMVEKLQEEIRLLEDFHNRLDDL